MLDFRSFLVLKPGVGQIIAMHASQIAKDLLLANFYPTTPPPQQKKQTSPEFFFFSPELAMANAGTCVVQRNKLGHRLVVTDD